MDEVESSGGDMVRGDRGPAAPRGALRGMVRRRGGAGTRRGFLAERAGGGPLPAGLLVVSLLLLLPALADGGLDGQERLVVLDRAASEAVLVDPDSREVVARLPVGLTPHEVAVSPDGRWAYVVNAGGGGSRPADAPGGEGAAEDADAAGPEGVAAERRRASLVPGELPRGTVTVLDLENQSVAGTYYPGGYAGLGGIDVSANGKRLWFTTEADSGVVELDARSGAVLMLWKTGGARSHSLVVGPRSRKIYVSNRGSDSVTRIDRLTVAVKRIPTGRGPDGLALGPGARELWVANRDDHTITVIDTRSERVMATLEAGGRAPARLAFRPDGKEVWVANRESGTISVFEVGCKQLVGTIALDVEPVAIVFAADGRRAFVSAPGRERVLVVDVAARSVVGEVPAGSTPDALAWSDGPVTAAAAPGGSR